MFNIITKFAFGATVTLSLRAIETPCRLLKTWRKQLEQVKPVYRMD
jgi:hypothetical protein